MGVSSINNYCSAQSAASYGQKTAENTAQNAGNTEKKYDSFTYIGGNSSDEPIKFYSDIGSRSTVTVDPKFYEKMAKDPELAEKYSKEINSMREADKKFAREVKARGGKIISRGWSIDKNGEISCWSAVKYEKKKSNLEKSRENLKKLRLKQAKKKKEKERLEKKMSMRKEEKLRLQGKNKKANAEKINRNKKKRSTFSNETLYNMYRKQTSKNAVSVSISCSSCGSLMDEKA